ncbi:hypothetical protein AC1031_000987, partial [Aphanomyces cochlioides]
AYAFVFGLEEFSLYQSLPQCREEKEIYVLMLMRGHIRASVTRMNRTKDLLEKEVDLIVILGLVS